MKTFTFICIFFVLTVSACFADSFYSDGDIANSKMYSAVGIEYELDTSGFIEFEKSNIKGEEEGYILSHTFTNLASEYNDAVVRRHEVAETMSIPPLTKINWGIWFYNATNHPINVNRVILFTSLNNGLGSDLKDIGLEGNTTFGEINSDGKKNYRTDKAIFLPWDYTYQPGVNNFGQVLNSFIVTMPIATNNFTASTRIENNRLYIDYLLEIINNTNKQICNVKVLDILTKDNKFEEEYCIEENEVKRIEYSEEITNRTTEIFNDGVLISNNNYIREDITFPVISQDELDLNTSPILFYRNDDSDISYYAQPALSQIVGNMYIEIIPYSFMSESVTIPIDFEFPSNIQSQNENPEPIKKKISSTQLSKKSALTKITSTQNESIDRDIIKERKLKISSENIQQIQGVKIEESSKENIEINNVNKIKTYQYILIIFLTILLFLIAYFWLKTKV